VPKASLGGNVNPRGNFHKRSYPKRGGINWAAPHRKGGTRGGRKRFLKKPGRGGGAYLKKTGKKKRREKSGGGEGQKSLRAVGGGTPPARALRTTAFPVAVGWAAGLVQKIPGDWIVGKTSAQFNGTGGREGTTPGPWFHKKWCARGISYWRNDCSIFVRPRKVKAISSFNFYVKAWRVKRQRMRTLFPGGVRGAACKSIFYKGAKRSGEKGGKNYLKSPWCEIFLDCRGAGKKSVG